MIPNTACSWTSITSSLDHPGKATKQVVSLGKEGVKQKVEQWNSQGVDITQESSMHKKVQIRGTW